MQAAAFCNMNTCCNAFDMINSTYGTLNVNFNGIMEKGLFHFAPSKEIDESCIPSKILFAAIDEHNQLI